MKGCELDTDGDGNCPVHPAGCPVLTYTTAEVGALVTEVARLRDRLKLDDPHPFPPGTDAADLWKMREDAYKAEIARLQKAMEPLLIAGHGSGPEFAPYFVEAAKSPIYWTEMCALLQEEIEGLRRSLSTNENDKVS